MIKDIKEQRRRSKESKDITPFQVAVRNNNGPLVEAIVDYLIVNDARDLFEKKDANDDSTALHIAAKLGRNDALRSLLKCKADLSVKDKCGNTPLHVAISNNQSAAAEIIVEHLRTLKENADAAVNARNKSGESALHVAARVGDNRLVELLLDLYADPCVTDKNGNTPLHLAVMKDNTNAIRLIAELMTEQYRWKCAKFGSKSSGFELSNNLKQTALHLVVLHGRDESIWMLMNHYTFTTEDSIRWWRKASDLPVDDYQDDYGNTAMFLAISYKKSEFVKECIRHKKKIDEDTNIAGDYLPTWLYYIRNKEGKNALDLAIERGDEATIQLLVSFNAVVASEIFSLLLLKSMESPKLINTFIQQSNAAVLTKMAEKSFEIHIGMNTMHFKRSDLSVILESTTPHRNSESPMKFGCNIGAARVLQRFLEAPNIYKFENKDYIVYKVDYLYKECLPAITRCGRRAAAWEMLNIEPFKTLTEPFWKLAEYLTGIVIVFHLIFMSLFTYNNTPTVEFLGGHFNQHSNETTYPANTNGTIHLTEANKHPSCVTGLWLLWPIMLLAIEFIYELTAERNLPQLIFKHLRRFKRWLAPRETVQETSVNLCGDIPYFIPSAITAIAGQVASTYRCIGLRHEPVDTHDLLLEVISPLFSGTFLFLCLMISWYSAYSFVGIFSTITGPQYLNLLAVTLIVGWLQTIKYFAFIQCYSETINRFLNVFHELFGTIFIVLFVIIMISFGFAMHVLHFTEPDGDIRSPVYSIYLTFNAMFGYGDLFDSTTNERLTAHSVNLSIIRLVFGIYMCLSAIVLTNLLISMTDETYKNKTINLVRRRTLLNLRFGLWLRSFDRLKWLLSPSKFIRKPRQEEEYLWKSKLKITQKSESKKITPRELKMHTNELKMAITCEMKEAFDIKISKLKDEFNEKIEKLQERTDELNMEFVTWNSDLREKAKELTQKIDVIYKMCEEISQHVTRHREY